MSYKAYMRWQIKEFSKVIEFNKHSINISMMTADDLNFLSFIFGSTRKLHIFLSVRKPILERKDEDLAQPWRGFSKRDNCGVIKGWVCRAKGLSVMGIQGLLWHQSSWFHHNLQECWDIHLWKGERQTLDPGIGYDQWVQWRVAVKGIQDVHETLAGKRRKKRTRGVMGYRKWKG